MQLAAEHGEIVVALGVQQSHFVGPLANDNFVPILQRGQGLHIAVQAGARTIIDHHLHFNLFGQHDGPAGEGLRGDGHQGDAG